MDPIRPKRKVLAISNEIGAGPAALMVELETDSGPLDLVLPIGTAEHLIRVLRLAADEVLHRAQAHGDPAWEMSPGEVLRPEAIRVGVTPDRKEVVLMATWRDGRVVSLGLSRAAAPGLARAIADLS
ncbi:MAG TPA: hypothetical protein VGC15_06180, partial [Acetobacteraceae bacterium]